MGWLNKLRRSDHNVIGQAYAITAFNAVLPGHEDVLEAYLEAMPMAAESPWAAMGGVHFIRLYVVRQFVHQGPSQQPDPLKNSYLVTDANVDGDLPGFVRALCQALPREAHVIYSHCVGYPGVSDIGAFQRWIEHNMIPNGVVLSPYPEASVPDIKAALALRGAVTDFAARAHLMDPETLQKSFRDTFGSDAAPV